MFPTRGYCESFNARFRDELLDGEIFYTLAEASVVIDIVLSVIPTSEPFDLGRRGFVGDLDQQTGR